MSAPNKNLNTHMLLLPVLLLQDPEGPYCPQLPVGQCLPSAVWHPGPHRLVQPHSETAVQEV